MSSILFTLDQLILIKTIATHGSFKSAAESLYISQPAVSLQVQKLERQLDILLFQRKGGKVKLTEAGHLLLQSGNKILTLCYETSRALEDLKGLHKGSLILGASQTTGTYLMPSLISLFNKYYPNISIQLHIDSTRHICWSVVNNEIDLAIIGGEVPVELDNQLHIIPYAEDELALIVPPDHPFASLQTINKEDLYNLEFIALEKAATIRRLVETLLKFNGVDVPKLKILMEFNSIEAIKNAVQAGLGVGFVSASAICKELQLNLFKKISIRNIHLKRNLFIVTNPNHYCSQAAEVFKYEILSQFQSSTLKMKNEFRKKLIEN